MFVGPAMERLENRRLDYAWGSRTVLAELLGEPSPSPSPEAEMWMGAHPVAPSVLARDPRRRTLAEWIEESPTETLGEDVARRFEGRLPFLLKVLAVDRPLSLQAHPSPAQAREGFDREERSGLARTSPRRNYRDPHHKPEILCALGPFEALCGFRPAEEALALLDALAAPSLSPVVARLRERPGPEGMREAFAALMSTDPARREALLGEVVAACRRACSPTSTFRAALEWVLELSALYPGDLGVAGALLLNLVHLEAGQSLFLPAGNLHAYLRGAGVELMANSDNVLRAGLTPKHVDVAELLRILDFGGHDHRLVVTREIGSGEREYVTPAEDFRLSVIEVDDGEEVEPERRGPEILLVVEGRAEVVGGDGRVLVLSRGQSAFVAAAEGPYCLRGKARVFRATVGDREED
jgi:mannose-6-phosphate isomerase